MMTMMIWKRMRKPVAKGKSAAKSKKEDDDDDDAEEVADDWEKPAEDDDWDPDFDEFDVPKSTAQKAGEEKPCCRRGRRFRH